MATLPSSEILELAGFVLLHCALIADSNRNGELICPFAVIVDASGRRLVDFESETQEEAVAKGWESLSESRGKSEWWSFGREGLIRDKGEATDVLTVSFWAPNMQEAASLIQRFARSHEQELYLLGGTDLLVHGPQGAELVEEWDRQALNRGIASHPKGNRWPHWLRH